MKKTKNKPNQQNDYEKIFEHPLDWCPLFGDLPKVFNTHLRGKGKYIGREINVQGNIENYPASTFEVAFDCIHIIKAARIYWGVVDYNLIKNDPAPDFEKLPIKIYKENLKKYQVARILFRNVDHLVWNILYPALEIDYFEGKSVTSWLKWTKTLIDSDVIVTHSDRMIDESQRIIASDYKISKIEFYSLCSILIAWHILAALCADKNNSLTDIITYKSIRYADGLLQTAERLTDQKHNEALALRVFIEDMKIKGYRELAKKGKEDAAKKRQDFVLERYKDLKNYKSLNNIIDNILLKIEEMIIKEIITVKDRLSKGTIRTNLKKLSEEGKIKLPEKQNRGPKLIFKI